MAKRPTAATCVYCCATKPVREFDREHVVPESFGKFRGTLTLAAPRVFRVCSVCNGGFGRSIDLQLSRHSFEALLRVRRGLANPDGLKRYLKHRITLRLPADHPLGPLYLDVGLSAGAPQAPSPPPQARIRLRDGAVLCVLEKDLADELPLLVPRIAPNGVSLFWTASDPSAEQRLKAIVVGAGYHVENWSPNPLLQSLASKEIDVEVTGVVDSVLARAIAKIGFNYLTYIAGSRAPYLLLQSRFDQARNFIRDGVGSWRHVVRPTNEPVLTNEGVEGPRAEGHVITLVWEQSLSEPILARVALFNDIRYDVTLASSPPAIWTELTSGHFYNLKTRTVSPLLTGRYVRPLG